VSRGIAFRVDASARIGVGHLMRCLTLADAVAQRGPPCRFVCRQLPQPLQDLIGERGHACAVLSDLPPGASESEDARHSAALLADGRWQWLIVDHYSLGASWERDMRSTARRLFVIDDLADRAHDCDILLDQNHLATGAQRYAGKVAEVGPRYALLRPEYRAWRQRRPPRNGSVQRVLVFFGGGDALSMTALALEALYHPDFAHLEIDVVVGSDEHLVALERQVAGRPGTRIHGPRPHLADLMSEADIAIGGGGSTTWERMCLGLQSLVVTLADNQVHVAKWLAHEGLIRLVGEAGGVSAWDLREALLDQIAQPGSLAAVERGMALCDGMGVSRVAEEMARVAGVPCDM
jgi:UDP-2,4-diacetamido-2,4,6-trideoxy-beta-L-altropyranose hydrolase